MGRVSTFQEGVQPVGEVDVRGSHQTNASIRMVPSRMSSKRQHWSRIALSEASLEAGIAVSQRASTEIYTSQTMWLGWRRPERQQRQASKSVTAGVEVPLEASSASAPWLEPASATETASQAGTAAS
jgi:hypothetical protein